MSDIQGFLESYSQMLRAEISRLPDNDEGDFKEKRYREELAAVETAKNRPITSIREQELLIRIESMKEVLEYCHNGLKWYWDSYPDSRSQADDEMEYKIEFAIKLAEWGQK